MARKPKAKPKRAPLTDEQRHARFVEMVAEVGATEDAEVFDEAFKKVVRASPPGAKKPNARR